MTVFLAEAGVQTEAHDREKKKNQQNNKNTPGGNKDGPEYGNRKEASFSSDF